MNILKTHGLFLLIAWTFSSCTVKSSISEGIYTLRQSASDTVSIHDIVKKEFQLDSTYSFYAGDEWARYWVKLPVKNSSAERQHFYFVFRYAYMSDGDFWVQKKDTIIQGHHHSHFHNLATPRYSNFPTWRFELEPMEEADVYFSIVGSGFRKELMLVNEEAFDQYKISQISSFTGYIIVVLFFSIVVAVLAVMTKRHYLFFYSAYLLFFIVDYGALNGFLQTYVWPSSHYLINSGRSISHMLITAFGCLFYGYFYQKRKAQKWVQFYFFFMVFAMVPFMVGYVIKAFDDIFPSLFLYLWSFLNFNFVAIFLVHVYLSFKKVIPRYLSFVFLLPIAGNIVRNWRITDINTHPLLTRLVDNGYFICLLLELSIFSLFLIREMLHSYSVKVSELEEEKEALKEQAVKSQTRIDKLQLTSNAVLATDEIVSIKSDGHYLEFFLRDSQRPEVDRNRIKEVLEVLPENFIRIHKSYIVNIDFIKEKYASKVVLKNNEELPVSRTFRPGLDEALGGS